MKKDSMITKVVNMFGFETEAQKKSRKRKEIFIGIISGLAASAPAIIETAAELNAMKTEADTKTDTTTTTDTKTTATATSKAPETDTTKKETIHKVPVACKEIFNFYAAVEVFCSNEKLQDIKFVKFDIEGNLRKLEEILSAELENRKNDCNYVKDTIISILGRMKELRHTIEFVTDYNQIRRVVDQANAAMIGYASIKLS